MATLAAKGLLREEGTAVQVYGVRWSADRAGSWSGTTASMDAK